MQFYHGKLIVRSFHAQANEPADSPVTANTNGLGTPLLQLQCSLHFGASSTLKPNLQNFPLLLVPCTASSYLRSIAILVDVPALLVLEGIAFFSTIPTGRLRLASRDGRDRQPWSRPLLGNTDPVKIPCNNRRARLDAPPI